MDEFKQMYFNSRNEVLEKELNVIKEAIESKYDLMMKKEIESLEEEYEEKRQKIISTFEKKILHEKQLAEKEWRSNLQAKQKAAEFQKSDKYVEIAINMKSTRLNNIIKNIVDGKSPIRLRIYADEKFCTSHIFHLTSQQVKQIESMKDNCEIILDKEQIAYIKEMNFNSDGYITKLYRRLNATEDDSGDDEKSTGKRDKINITEPKVPETKPDERKSSDRGTAENKADESGAKNVNKEKLTIDRISMDGVIEGRYTVQQLKDILDSVKHPYNSKSKKGELQAILIKYLVDMKLQTDH